MPKAQKNIEQTSTVQNTTELLETEEVLLCKQLAAEDPPWSQRAQALLAIHHGSTAEAAGEASGLRTTQVNFWLNKFHNIRMGIFPEELLKTAENNSPAAIEPPPGDGPTVLAEPGKGKKKKKAKQEKDKQGKSKKKKKKSKKKSGKAKRSSGKTKQK